MKEEGWGKSGVIHITLIMHKIITKYLKRRREGGIREPEKAKKTGGFEAGIECKCESRR